MEHLVLGSYVTQKHIRTGMGVTTQGQQQAIMCLAVQLPAADICVQPLDISHIPTGIVSTVGNADFFRDYLPEPDCYDRHIRPKVKTLSEWIGAAGTPMPQEKPDHASGRLLRAFLAVLHGESGMTMREGDLDRVRALAHQARDMHFYAHFQVSIAVAAMRQRKERNYPLAIDFYSRALEVKENDRLLFNIARAYYEMKNIDAAKKSLTRALALNPELVVARQFLDFIAAPSTN